MTETVRARRLNVKTVQLPLFVDTDAGATLSPTDVWREDFVVCATGPEPVFYKVLDFGEEERLYTVGELNSDPSGPPIKGATTEWRKTGTLLVQLQAVDPVTGEGLSNPTVRPILPAPLEGETDTSWRGWAVQPVSPRRPQDDSPEVGEKPPGKVITIGTAGESNRSTPR